MKRFQARGRHCNWTVAVRLGTLTRSNPSTVNGLDGEGEFRVTLWILGRVKVVPGATASRRR